MQVYTEKSDGIKMKFDSGSGRHGNNIDDIASGFSWEGACEAMKTHLYNKGYVSVSCSTDLISHPTYLTALSFSILQIKSGAECKKSTVIYLEYEPNPTWYTMSSNTGANNDNEKFKCEYQIANKGSWCSSGDIIEEDCPSGGVGKCLRCSTGGLQISCEDGRTMSSKPTVHPTPLPTRFPTPYPTPFPTKFPTPKVSFNRLWTDHITLCFSDLHLLYNITANSSK